MRSLRNHAIVPLQEISVDNIMKKPCVSPNNLQRRQGFCAMQTPASDRNCHYDLPATYHYISKQLGDFLLLRSPWTYR
jgi:hypothetical protein